jgi:hypothetical protein
VSFTLDPEVAEALAPFAAEAAGSTPPPVDFVAFDTSAARRVIADRVRALASL